MVSRWLLDVEHDEDACNIGDIEDQARDGHDVVGVALIRRGVAHERGKPTKQTREDRDGEPVVTETAAHFGRSSAIAHRDPNRFRR